MSPSSKILIPLDFDSADQAVGCAAALQKHVYGYKVGLQLVNAAGFGIFDRIRTSLGADARFFYDCKFHDIPNTVHGACRAASARGLWMLNVHAAGGRDMLIAAVDGSHAGTRSGTAPPLVIAVTILTSISRQTLNEDLRVPGEVTDQVTHLALLAKDAGCDGVVVSPHEVAAIREACGQDFVIVTPGVRPAGSSANDQQRVMTPSEAVARGSNYLVIGRPITASTNPAETAANINDEVTAAAVR